MVHTRSTRRVVPAFVMAIGVAWAITLASEVAPQHATTAIGVVAVQAAAGIVLLAATRAARRMSPLELIAVGAPLGFVASLLCDHAARSTWVAGWGWVAPAVLAAVTLIIRRDAASDAAYDVKSKATPDPTRATPDRVTAGWITATGLLILGGGWYWSSVVGMAVAAVAAACTRLLAPPRRPVVRATTVIAGAAATAVAIATRPATWWIEDSDYGFFEALGVSFSRWGARDDALAVGYPIRYHWFVYGWTGMIDRIAGTPPWVVLSRAGLVVGALLVALQLWCILRRLGMGPTTAGPALVGLALFDTFDSWGSGFRLGITSTPSHLVGFAWLLALVAWWLTIRSRDLTLSAVGIAALLLAGATGAKVSHGVAGAAFVGAGTLLDAVRRRSSLWRSIALLGGCGAALVAVYVAVFRGAGNLGRAWLLFPVSLQGELVDYPGWPTRVAAGAMMWGFAGAVVVGLVVVARAGTVEPSVLWSAAVALAAGGVLAAGTVSVFGSQLYFLHSALWLALPIVVAGTWHAAVADPRRRVGLVVAGSAAVVSCVVYRVAPDPASGAVWAIAARLTAPTAGIIAALLIGGVHLRQQPARRSALGWVLAAGLLFHGVGVGVVNWVDGIRREYPGFAREQEGRVGSADLQSAAAWIDAELPENTILGSNDERPLVVALARRRMLLQTDWLIARHTRETPERDAEFEDRTMLQRAFAAAPTESLRERLVAKGAEWFLVRLEPGTDWMSDVGTVRYRNAGYVVVEL